MSKTQIKINNVTQIYGLRTPFEQKALDGVSLTIDQGDFLAIVGITGSGKSTLIQHLNALIKPTSGDIEILDFKITPSRRRLRKIKELRRRVGVVFQFAEYQIFESTIEREIIFGPKNFGISHDEAIKRAKKYIKIVGLSTSMLQKSPFGLSGGQKRRVAIASVLSCEPEILIFDEPIAGLDPSGAYDILQILKELNNEGKTIIMVTHNLDNALEYSNKTLIMKDTRVEHNNDTNKLLLDPTVLHESSLLLPQVTSFVNELADHKVNLPNNINNIVSLSEAIIDLLKQDKRKKNCKTNHNPRIKKTAAIKVSPFKSAAAHKRARINLDSSTIKIKKKAVTK